MTKHNLDDRVSNIIEFHAELESRKRYYQNSYDSTGISNFEKAALDMGRAQSYLERALSPDLGDGIARFGFGPVMNYIAGFAVGTWLAGRFAFYSLRGAIHGEIGHNKSKKH